MKKLILCSFIFLQFKLVLIASVFTIGNDTIHKINNAYYFIGVTDTFNIDTSMLFVEYSNLATAYNKAAIEANYSLTKEYEYSFGWISYTYALSNNSFISLATALDNEFLIAKVDYNVAIHYACEAQEPDDYYRDDQWYLDQIQAPYAWALTTGNPDIIVAILDTGFDWAHPDLGPGDDGFDNIYLNGLEDDWAYWDDPTSGNEHDDGNNGCEDDWKGWGEMYDENHYPPFFLGNDVRNYSYDWLNTIYPGDPASAEKQWLHGTFIAGIIAAKTNNDGEGISGIAGGWNNQGTSLLLFKAGVSNLDGSYADRILYAIDYTTSYLPDGKKARIIEMAFTTHDYADHIKTAIDNAYQDHDVFFVAAAGIHVTGFSPEVGFPANHPYVFAVGATDIDDIRIASSNYGPELDMGAPGEEIYGIVPTDGHDDDGYQTINGSTSAASAMVAGTAALVLAVNPNLHNFELAEILEESADKGTNYQYDEFGHNDEIGFGRLNAYKAVCLAGSYLAEPTDIEDDVTWDSNKSIFYDVAVKTGVTLTITAEIQFGPEAKLIIEPGGTVVVDTGILTNMKCCDNENISWPGVEVWGNQNASQHTPGAQGKLVLMNEAKIENAVVAVELWKPGDYNSTGGIIEAENSTFLNNACAVHAIYYRNFNPANPNTEVDYIGTFTNCTFSVDNEYIGYKTFYKHVDLNQIRGIKFYGCSFSLDHEAENASEWSLGIAAYNAGFNVLPTCTSQVVPCPLIDSCLFNGFNWAIGAYNNSIYPILIKNAHFDDNVTGVYLSDVDYAVVLENFFEAGYNDPYVGNCGFAYGVGVDIQQSNGFAVENNHFRKNNLATSGNYAGIRVRNCPSVHDVIYKNELIGLSFANYAEGTNRSNAGWDATGVEYRCNNNDGNTIDYMVKNISGYDGMIRGAHGSLRPDTACGNSFSPNATWHIRNEGRQTILWVYNMNNTPEIPINIYEIDPIYVADVPVDDQNECLDHYGGGNNLELTFEERQTLEMEFAQNLSNYYSVETLYESLIDGGNTEAELSDIQTAEPDDMWALRSHLLGLSPHLSQEVLRTVSERTDVFPDEVLFDILSANPDELDKDTLLSYLEQKENPLPEYMLEILRQFTNGVTYKTILREDMAYYYTAKTQAAQDIIRSILNDSAFHVADYRNWLDNLGGLEADKKILASYLYENDTTSALQILDLIPGIYYLEGQELDDFNEYKELLEMQIAWNTEGKSLLQLDSLDFEILESYASNGTSPAGNMARNILEYANYQHYCNCLESTDSSNYKSSWHYYGLNKIKQNGLFVSVEPNPAKTWVAFNYKLPNELSSGMLTISDISGKLIYQLTISGKAGQKVLNCDYMEPGVYYFTLSVSGFSRSGKFIIQ